MESGDIVLTLNDEHKRKLILLITEMQTTITDIKSLTTGSTERVEQ